MNRRGLTNTRPYFFFVLLLFFGLFPTMSHAQVPAQQQDPQAQAHRNKAIAFAGQNDWSGAITELQAAYALDQKDDPLSAAWDMATIGNCYDSLKDYANAIASEQTALAYFQKTNNTAGLAKALDLMGQAYSQTSQYSKAINTLQQALPFTLKAKDASTEANTLMNLASAYDHSGQHSKAISYFGQAIPIFQSLKDSEGQAAVLNGLGSSYQNLHQFAKSLSYFRQALAINRRMEDQDGQATTLANLGACCNALHQYNKAILFSRQALTIHQTLSDPEGQARDLSTLGDAYHALTDNNRAAALFQQAAALYQQLHNANAQANALNQEGMAHADLSEYNSAMDCFQQALPLFVHVNNQDGQATVLNNAGNVSNKFSRYDQAVSFYQQALALRQQLNDKDGQADAFNGLGNAYNDLNQYSTAIGYFQKALALYQQLKDQEGEADALNNLGTVYENINHYPDAVRLYQQALTIDRQIKNSETEANALLNLGVVYTDLHQYPKAIGFYIQALRGYRKINDIDGQASVLLNAGYLSQKLNQPDKAMAFLQPALPLFQQTGDRAGEALAFSYLAAAWALRDNPCLTIFYGKQAINVYQSIRQDIHTMDKTVQRSYLKDKEPTYRELAELLISQGRLPEAEQVLNLLKDQEFFDFVRRDPAVTPTAGVASLTPIEDAWQARYQVIADKVTTIGQTKQDLLSKQQQANAGQITLTTAQKDDLQKQLTQTDADLTVANQAFQKFLTQLATEAQNATQAAQDRVQTVTDATAFEDTLSQLGPGTVALYTIVEADKIRILVVTSQTQVAREYPIKSDDLRAKVLAFRQVLQDPTRDPRPLAHDLYTILVGPIEKDLAGANATTLMWSLDDVLRYLPMAALYDGKEYMVERYKNDVFTPASESRLTETPKAEWNGLGLGVSQAHPGFLALTGVPQELDGVIHDPSVTASQAGALPGTILLDSAFTQQTMTQALEARKYPLVHIASHFDFQPGDETNSFLLLGDGSHLSLSTIKTLPQVFQGVDLLTLSACDTADGGTGADGREVEGFAVLAQRLGAKAVIASLWPVADASTPLLMDAFYGQLSHGNISKGEALRQAQLSLLHGTTSGTGSAANRAQIVPDKKDKSAGDAPAFTPDPKAPFAHPYYWAPFILIGNWK